MLPGAHTLGRSRTFLVVSALGLLMAPVSARAFGELCGAHLWFGGTDHAFTGHYCIQVTPGMTERILGSPSGLAYAGSSGIGIKLSAADGGPVGVSEFWITGGQFSGEPPDNCNGISPPYPLVCNNPYSGPTDRQLECSDPVFEATNYCGYPYFDISDANGSQITWYPTFGGHGNIGFYVKIDDNNFYSAAGGIEMRSTDIDGDGDTDEDDENAMVAAINSPTPDVLTYDLNFDNVVDAGDLAILVAEANRRDGSNLPYARARCTHQADYTPTYDWNNYKMYPPAAVTLSGGRGASTETVVWTAPGDDGNTGTATTYDLRISTTPITSANFGNMDQVGTGAPAPAGTPECVTVQFLQPNTNYYYALKTMDDLGNWSAMSNCLTLKTRVSGTEVGCEPGLMSPVTDGTPGPAELTLTVQTAANVTPGQLRLSYAVPQAVAGAPLDIAVFDVAGRNVGTIEKGIAAAGMHSIAWNINQGGGSARAGFYFVRLRVGEEVRTRTAIVNP